MAETEGIHASIERLAHHHWELRGCPLWDSETDWYAAEAELRVATSGSEIRFSPGRLVRRCVQLLSSLVQRLATYRTSSPTRGSTDTSMEEACVLIAERRAA
jgi:hypothetical protein